MGKRVVVIGAGVIGCCVAYYAALDGHRVTLLDRSTDTFEGCSFGNAGMVTPSHFVPLAAPGMVAMGLRMMWNPQSPFYIKPRLNAELLSWGLRFWRSCSREHVQRAAPVLARLLLASRACYQQLAADAGNEFSLVERGLLMLCKSGHTLEEEARLVPQAHKLGIAAEVLTAPQTQEREPALRMDVAGSVFFPMDSHLTPASFMRSMRARLGRMPVQWRWGTPIDGWRTANGRVTALRTPSGDIEGDEFVLAAGSWSSALARDLGVRMPLQAGKGYSLTVKNPPALPALCAILTEARVAVTPMDGQLRFAGTMEMSGLSEAITAVRVRGIINAVPAYMPQFTPSVFAGTPPWCGLRPCSPDGLPYLGRLARTTNVIAATGHAMMGVSLAPITGTLAAQMISERAMSISTDSLRPERFG